MIRPGPRIAKAPEDQFALSDGEKHHPLWLRLVEHFYEKIDTAHARLEGEISEQLTATLRGQIKTLRALIALSEDMSPQDDE